MFLSLNAKKVCGGLCTFLLVSFLGVSANSEGVAVKRTLSNYPSFAPLVKRAAPSVVNIFTTKTIKTRAFSPLFDDPFFRRFFGQNFGSAPQSRKKVQNSLGSGVIVKSNGTIITNHHVIAGAD
ncbi:MAG: serine protease, partial [Pseudomonadota bacterium]|nr:serine protease [Pseudomonadota bacterium]